MRVALKPAAIFLAGVALLTQPETAGAVLSCNPMNSSTPNANVRGIWKWWLPVQNPLVCTFRIGLFGLTTGTPNVCNGPPGWPTTGTLTGNIIVSANCIVTGTLTLNAPAPAIPQTYTLDAVLHQSAKKSANIIMGALVVVGGVLAGREYSFSMIQSGHP